MLFSLKVLYIRAMSQVFLLSYASLLAYGRLLKFRLSFVVALSSLLGYAWGGALHYASWGHLLILFLGGFCVSASAGAFNQIIERHEDKQMVRTHLRPLPQGLLSIKQACLFAFLVLLVGLFLLWGFGFKVLLLSLLSVVLYVLVYTPFKKVGSVAVFIGALPGALPVLIGYVAAVGFVDHAGWLYFGLQWLWQFPHFWAIAWVAHKDYQKAGFKLLPTGAPSQAAAWVIVLYVVFLLPLGLLPTYFGYTGSMAAGLSLFLGLLFLASALALLRHPKKRYARALMFVSFVYLPALQIVLVVDKL